MGDFISESELLITQMDQTLVRLSLAKLRNSFENAIPRRIAMEETPVV